MLGFFTHPELTKESEAHASGNYALLDLIAALRWVQESIAAFGGDPANVTVGGQSAGASNTHSLTASPLAKGLLHRAIAESGSSVAAGAGTRTLAEQEQLGVKFAEAKGARSLADLRALSWKDLSAPVTAAGSANGPAPTFRFGVVVDGYVLPRLGGRRLRLGQAERRADSDGCQQARRRRDAASGSPQTRSRNRPNSGGDLADEFLSLYPSATDEQARLVQNESSWDQARVSIYLWAMNRARTAKTKAFTYFWDHPLPGPEVDKCGAFHTSEVPYVMNALGMSDRPFTDQDRRIADTLASCWANFIKTGDPNGPGLPLAGGHEGAGRDDGNRRQERTHSSRRDAEQARVLREVLRAPAGAMSVAF